MAYIFQWRVNGIQVEPSKAATKEDVWEFAIKWLRPHGMNDKAAEKLIRREGEVVLVTTKED